MAKTEKKSTATSDFTKRLKAANKAWGSAKEKAAESTGPVEFEDGRYMARLTKAELGESGSGRLQAVFHFKFEDEDEPGKPNYGGQVKYDYQGVETEQNLEFFGRRLDQLGYTLPDDLTEIVDILADITKEKPLCRIRLKSKGDFQNVYIDKVFGAEVDGDDEEAEGDETEEEAVEVEEPKKAKGKGKAKPVVEEEEEEEESDDDEAEEDEAEETEDEEEEDDDTGEEGDEVDLTVGMTVDAETSKGTVRAEVVGLLPDEGKARIKTEDGKVIRVAIDKLTMVEEVPEEPAPKAKKTKK